MLDRHSRTPHCVTSDLQRQRFQEVVLPHLDDALSLARWLTGNATDAEDVVQDACIRAFGAVSTLKDGNPRAWLLTIVRNTAFTWLAKNKPKALIVTGDERVFEQAAMDAADHAPMPTPETDLIHKADAAMLHDAIAGLPLPYREVLVLREIEGLSYRDISEIVAIPVGTVMSRLARARSQLIERVARANTGKAGAA
jgi:RNA polymerase sigma factor (sigma-70 family)